MGVKGLFQFLEAKAPLSFRQVDIKVQSGKTVTCDASNVMYAIMVTTAGTVQAHGGEAGGFEMTDKEGNPTAHLVGLLSRTVNFLEIGIKPIWVFDGKPPELKMEELKKRKEAKAEAQEQMVEAKDVGNAELVQ